MFCKLTCDLFRVRILVRLKCLSFLLGMEGADCNIGVFNEDTHQWAKR